MLDLLAVVGVTGGTDLQPRPAGSFAALAHRLLIAIEPDAFPGHVVHRPEDEQVHRRPMVPEQLKVAAELAPKGPVTRTLPVHRLQRLGHLPHLVDDALSLVRVGDAAGGVGMQPVEPGMRLILRAERIVALAVRSHPPRDEAWHLGDRGAGQQPPDQTPGLVAIGCSAAAASPLADRGQIRSREHGPVLDGTPPADRVGPPLLTVFGSRQVAHIIVDQPVVPDELAPQDGMRPVHRCSHLIGRRRRPVRGQVGPCCLLAVHQPSHQQQNPKCGRFHVGNHPRNHVNKRSNPEQCPPSQEDDHAASGREWCQGRSCPNLARGLHEQGKTQRQDTLFVDPAVRQRSAKRLDALASHLGPRHR